MSKSIYKKRKYPHSVRKVQSLPLLDVESYERYESTNDTSMGLSVSKSWITDNDNSPQKERYHSKCLQPHEQRFIRMILEEDFYESERNNCALFFEYLVKNYKEIAVVWLLQLFIDHQGEEFFLIQLLRLVRCFSYEFIKPASFCLLEMGLHHNSDFVKSEALSLIDHWNNPEVLSMLKNFEPPITPWLQMKYYVIRELLERYVTF